MNFELFISRRLSESKLNKQYYSGPITKICITSICVCVTVMIITISIGLGMQKTITNKLTNAISDIKIHNKYSKQINSTICINDNTLEKINQKKGVSIEPVAEIKGIININHNTEYILLKGIQTDTYKSKIINYIDSGSYFSNHNNNEMIISSYLKEKLKLKIGEKCIIHYYNGHKNTKYPFRIIGSYKMDLQEHFDEFYVFAKKEEIQKINYTENNTKKKSQNDKVKKNWHDTCKPIGLVSYYEVNTNNNHTINQNIKKFIENNYPFIMAESARDRIPQVFTWIDLLYNNVFFILIIMIIICIINITNVLLIIILERLKMIGILKSFGCSNYSILKIFMYTSWRITKKSLLFGNLIGLSLCLIQKKTNIILLNPETYFSSYIPIEFNIMYILLINIVTFIIIHIGLIAPYYIIRKITPSNILKIT